MGLDSSFEIMLQKQTPPSPHVIEYDYLVY